MAAVAVIITLAFTATGCGNTATKDTGPKAGTEPSAALETESTSVREEETTSALKASSSKKASSSNKGSEAGASTKETEPAAEQPAKTGSQSVASSGSSQQSQPSKAESSSGSTSGKSSTGGNQQSVSGKTSGGDTPAHKHSYKKTVLAQPTCTSAGKAKYTCSCGDSYEETINSLGHDWKTQNIAPTCEGDGWNGKVCSRCGEKQGSVVSATGHKWDWGTITQPATCSQDGVSVHTCSACGATYDEVIPCTGEHNFVESGDIIYYSIYDECWLCNRCGQRMYTNEELHQHVGQVCKGTYQLIKYLKEEGFWGIVGPNETNSVVGWIDPLNFRFWAGIRYSCTDCGYSYDEYF